MKNILTLILVAFGGFVMAQSNVSAKEMASKFTEVLNLNEAQQKKMVQIQETKVQNLASIEAFRSSDYQLYMRKRHSIAEGTTGSVRLMLSKEQYAKLDTYLREQRNLRYENIKNLMAQGADKKTIDEASIPDDF
jgi:uncharacterized protein YoaH (UPF0181 family)